MLVPLLFLLLFQTGTAQAVVNPFDLLPRLEQAVDSTAILALPGNPFDLVATQTIHRRQYTTPGFSVEREQQQLTTQERTNIFKRFQFGAILTMLIWLTLLFIIFRIFIAKIWLAFLNDNLMHQLMRVRSPGSSATLILLYCFFFYTCGLFIFLAINHYGHKLSTSYVWGLALCTIGAATFFIFKHLEWYIFRSMLPAGKELATLSFSTMIFNTITGLLLVPVILFTAYAPETLTTYTIYIGLILMGLVYSFLLVRVLFNSVRFLLHHKIHFLFYLCAAEIAPVLLLLKIILG